jgi:ParB-like chromosome segregation protein Spo0J
MKKRFSVAPAGNKQANLNTHPNSAAPKAVSVPEPARVSIDAIKIPKGFRPIRKKTVRRLLISIRAIGLQNPIAVRNKGDGTVLLVAGGHRLEAFKQLGLTHISARILDPITSDIWNASENKDRAELTRLEQDRDIVAMARALKRQNHRLKGGVQPHDKGNSRVARAMNITTKEVRQAKRRIGICAKAKSLAEQNGLDNNAAALDRIAACTSPSDEVRMANAIINEQRLRKTKQIRKKRSKERQSGTALSELKDAWLASTFRRRFLKADALAREKFAKQVFSKDV